MTDYENICEIIKSFNEMHDELELNTLNVISNLLWELKNLRRSSAVYTRTIRNGKLKIDIDYRESNG